MTYAIYADDNFTNAPATGTRSFTYPTTAGAANSLTGVGNGWKDIVGGAFNIDASNVLNVIVGSLSGSSYTSIFLDRPTTETWIAQQMVVTFPTGYLAAPGGGTFFAPVLRKQTNGDHYFFNCVNNQMYAYKIVGGGLGTVFTSATFSTTSSHQFSFAVQADAPVAGATTFTMTITDITTSTVVSSQTFTDNSTSLQGAGYAGFAAWTGGSSNGKIARVQLYQNDTATQTFTLSPTAATISIPRTVTATGTSTSWVNGTTTFSVTGGTGASISGLSISGQVATFTLNPGSATGALVIHDSLDTATATITVGATSVTVSPTSATLGVPVIVTLTSSGTTWTGSARPTITGGTNPAYTDFSITGQVMTFRINPGTSIASLTIGNTFDANTTTFSALAAIVDTNIVYHGDSLTYGQYGTNPGAATATRLAAAAALVGPTSQFSNQGTSGQTLTTMAASLTGINAAYDGSKTYNILVVQGGHNDLYNGGTFGVVDALAVESRIRTYLSNVLAVHPWLIIWCTELPASHPAYPPNFDTMRDAINVYMRANWQSLGIAYLNDVALDYRIGLPGCEKNATYFNSGDFTHPIDPGYTVWGADYDGAAIQAVKSHGSFAGISGVRISGSFGGGF